MSNYQDSLKNLDGILNFLKKNNERINWNKFSKEIAKLDLQLKKSIKPSKEIEEIFLNKRIFSSLTKVKEFLSDNFKIDIKGKSKAEILPQITYFCINNPNFVLDIKKSIDEKIITAKPKIVKKHKTIQKKKAIVITETWKDWTKYESNALKNHLNNLTVKQIKSITGKLLPSKEKNVRKTILIDNVVKKINKLKAHYEMGPG